MNFSPCPRSSSACLANRAASFLSGTSARLAPLRVKIRSLGSGAAVAAGTPRPALLVLLVGNVTGLHAENMAVIEALLKKCDTVLIGDLDDAVVFDWDPTLPVGGGHAPGPRGTDWRLG